MFSIMLRHSMTTDAFTKIRYISIDSQFITNRYMCNKHIGRHKFYKSKNGIKLSTIVDNNGIPLSLILKAGNLHDSKMVEETVNNIQVTLNKKKYNLLSRFWI
jgi:transposase